MKLVIPEPLRAGDTVAVVSLSWGGPATLLHRYQAGKRQLEAACGIKVIEMPHALRDAAWIAANPRARADDLHQAFADKNIKAVISSIGGDDSIRTLPFMDYDLLRANPKIFLGYSDTTTTHFALLKAGVRSYYGPAIMAGFGENGGLHAYTEAAVRAQLFAPTARHVLAENMAGWTVERLTWVEPANQTRKRSLSPSSGWRYLQGAGQHRGHLIGGCAELIDWLRGTPVWPSDAQWQGAALFLELSEETVSPQFLQRMLRCLAACGVLQRLSGILFARPGGGVPPETFVDYDRALMEVVVGENGLVDLPIVSNMDFGHTDPMCLLPYGAQVEIDCDGRRVTLLEPATASAG